LVPGAGTPVTRHTSSFPSGLVYPSVVTQPLSPSPAAAPPDYPRAFERRIGLTDGREVFVRPIVPDDAGALGEALRDADPETLRSRFLGGSPHVTPTLLSRLTTLDYARRFAIVAADGRTGRGVGIARYETVEGDVAEVAVAVDPGWRRVGLATALVELLAEAALERGIYEFTASFLAENRPVVELVRLAGPVGRQVIREGIAEVAFRLDREPIEAANPEDQPHG
jgi:GNAT superfamily N-acetyltransferase